MSNNFDSQIIEVPVREIVIGRTFKNIRRYFDEESVRNLAENIQQNGLMNPIVVMQSEDENGNTFTELVAGERRLRAISYVQNNLDSDFMENGIPCIQYVGTIVDAKYANASENIDREDVDDVDVSTWLFDRTQEGIPQTELGERLHRSPQWVNFRVTFHERACDELKDAVREKILSFTAAYELAKNLTQDEQRKRIAKARKFNEKITLEEAQRADKPEVSPKPSKKAIDKMLAFAERNGTDYGSGFCNALRWVQGTMTEEEVRHFLDLAAQGRL